MFKFDLITMLFFPFQLNFRFHLILSQQMPSQLYCELKKDYLILVSTSNTISMDIIFFAIIKCV